MQTALSSAVVSTSARSHQTNRLVGYSSIDVKPGDPISSSGKKRDPSSRLRIHTEHGDIAQERVEHAIEGNHLAIQQFLQRQLHRPSTVDFNSSTLRPGYRAAERLIVKSKVDRSIVSHLHLEPQAIRFGRSEMPVARVRDFATLPEYHGRGVCERMLAAAEAEAKRSGAMLMIAASEDYRLLKREGWASLGSDPVSIVSPQGLLGRLPARAQPESPFYAAQIPKEEVRIGRLTDLAEMQDLFQQQHAESYGSVIRPTEQWSWLASKHAHDRILIFSESERMLAYVVVRGSSVLELIDVTDDGRGSARLLERVGADAIDQGRHTLRIHAPLSDRVHHWADLGGGQVFAAPPEDSWMVKILSVRKLLRRLANELYRRRVPNLTDLSVRIGADELRIRQGVRSMKVTRGRSEVHRIGLTTRAAAQLFLGYRTADELAEQQQLVTSSSDALDITRQLFPATMLWRTRWDDVSVVKS